MKIDEKGNVLISLADIIASTPIDKLDDIIDEMGWSPLVCAQTSAAVTGAAWPAVSRQN